MTNSQHPDPEMLMDFIDNPGGPQFRQLGRHLAECVECRSHAASLQNLASGLATRLEHVSQPESTLTEQEITALIQQRLSAAELVSIKQDPNKLKAALHLAAHNHGMGKLNRAVASTSAPVPRPITQPIPKPIQNQSQNQSRAFCSNLPGK